MSKGPLLMFELDGLFFEGGYDDIYLVLGTLREDEIERCRVDYLRPVKVGPFKFKRKVPLDVSSLRKGLESKK